MRWWNYHVTPTHTKRRMQTSHTAPSTDKPAIRLAHNHLYSQVDAAVAAAEGRTALSTMVLVLLPLMRALGTSILRQVIQHRDRARDQERKPVPCPGCQAPLLRTRHLRPTRRYTLLGLLTYERRNYLCSSCKRSEYPGSTTPARSIRRIRMQIKEERGPERRRTLSASQRAEERRAGQAWPTAVGSAAGLDEPFLRDPRAGEALGARPRRPGRLCAWLGPCT